MPWRDKIRKYRKKIILSLKAIFVVLSVFLTSFSIIGAANNQQSCNKYPLFSSPVGKTYEGRLRVYVVEPISRWKDDQVNPFEFGFLDFAANTTLSIEYQDTYNMTIVWDAQQAGYDNVQVNNIMVIAVVFNSEKHQGYADPPTGNPFDAYYVDATAAATPGTTGYNTVMENFSHTIFCEEGTSSGCPACPYAREALHTIYESHDYPFYYTALVYDNPKTHERLINELHDKWVPTLFFDGGHSVLVGCEDAEARYRNAIETCGRRDAYELNLTVSLEWLGNGVIQINVSITNNESNENPQITIGEITSRWGGFDNGAVVSAEIKNNGTADATHINWSISAVGGIFGRINVFDTGMIDTLGIGNVTTVKTMTPIRGLGPIEIIILAKGIEKRINGLIFGPFILLQ